jgi:hypothetical protein
VFIGATEGPNTIGVPTATGLTFTSVALNTAASTCGTRAAVAKATAAGSQVVSATNVSSTNLWGFGIWVFAGAIQGATGEQHTTTHTVSVTPQGEHSAWCIGAFDFSATAVTGNSITPTVTTSRQKALVGTNYSIYVGEIADQGSKAATAYGLTAGGTAGAISIVAVEVKGLAVWSRAPVPMLRAATW